MTALGRGSKEILAEVGMEVIQPEIPEPQNSAPTSQSQSQPQPSASVDPPELRAATAIPAIVEILQDVDHKYHKVIFRSVIDLLTIRDSDCVKPWEVNEPIKIEKPRRWWSW